MAAKFASSRRPSPGLALVLGLIALLLLFFLMDYLFLPPWNFQAWETWVFMSIWLMLASLILLAVTRWKSLLSLGFLLSGVILVLVFLLSIGSWLIWLGNDQRYQAMLTVTERPAEAFAERFDGASPDARGGVGILLPVIDKDLSIVQATGKLGTYGAQFQIDTEIFSSVNVVRGGVQEKVRVTGLEYSGFFVALGGGGVGTPGYIEVEQKTGTARLVETQEGLRFMPSGVFGYDLARHLRFSYRSALFGSWSFEIDDDGNPWWVVPVLENTVGFFGGPEVKQVLLVNPSSGVINAYDPGSEPGWVERVYPSNLVLEQAYDHLSLKEGWFNRTFGTMIGVLQPSDGYSYVSTIDGEHGQTWLVTGITSPNEADQTTTGLLMVNLKTKEAHSFALPGITEMRAMEIAENDERVRAQELVATWPIFVSIRGRTTYYMLLRNNVQRQRYVFVDVDDGIPMVMADTFEGILSQFVKASPGDMVRPEDVSRETGSVLRVSVENGNLLGFLLNGQPTWRYLVPRGLNNGTRFMAPGDRVEIGWREGSTPEERIVVDLENRSLE